MKESSVRVGIQIKEREKGREGKRREGGSEGGRVEIISPVSE